MNKCLTKEVDSNFDTELLACSSSNAWLECNSHFSYNTDGDGKSYLRYSAIVNSDSETNQTELIFRAVIITFQISNRWRDFFIRIELNFSSPFEIYHIPIHICIGIYIFSFFSSEIELFKKSFIIRFIVKLGYREGEMRIAKKMRGSTFTWNTRHYLKILSLFTSKPLLPP